MNGIQFQRVIKIGYKLVALLLLLALTFNVIQAQNFSRVEEEANINHITSNNGVSVADFDQDGDLDVFLTGYKQFNPEDETTWNRLLRNDGDGKFTDVTLEAGFGDQFVNDGLPASLGEKLGASWGDYDNDGFPDLFLANSRLDQLYHNQGNGTFIDVTAQAGVAGCNECYSSTGLWWDYDKDGDLDLYVNNLKGANRMYDNLGDGTFRDITIQTGLGGWGVTWASVTLDVGRDGFVDLYAINDTQENQFWENRGGRLNEVGKAYRLNDPGAGMGVTIGDYNNDGFFDVYITNIYSHHPNPLFTDNGNRKFINLAVENGVENTGWGWGTKFFDFDHDGDEDLYAVNGVPESDYIYDFEQQDENNFLFKNLRKEGVENFADWSVESGTNGSANGRGVEVFDYDRDGDLDILVANMSEAPYLYRNETIGRDEVQANGWLQIILEGTVSNRSAFGTELKASIGEHAYYRYYQGAGIFGQSIKPVHFGFGSEETLDELTITWPNGENETIYDIPLNQTIKIKEGEYSGGSGNEKEEDGTLKIEEYTVARLWNEELLQAIRNDFARPTVHARNLYHVSAAMYDAWSAYDHASLTYFLGNKFKDFFFPFDGAVKPENIQLAQREAISYACYRLINHRFHNSPGWVETSGRIISLMSALGYDIDYTNDDYKSGNPAALGNYIANKIIEFGLLDGSNENNDYNNSNYVPINPPLVLKKPGSQDIIDPNRWQPLAFDSFVDQSGHEVIGGVPDFLGAEWGRVIPFALQNEDISIYQKEGVEYRVYHDPGDPSYIDSYNPSDYKWNFSLVAAWSSHLDPSDGVMWDISPGNIGNLDIADLPKSNSELNEFYKYLEGGDPGVGYTINPKTNQPYQSQVVPRGDYTRVLAEFWADGPDSETPPGHWFTILNYINDHPLLEKKFQGKGRALDSLEWDVKSYFILGGAMHDAAIAAWGIKGYYDFVRPISAIRFMADKGQSTSEVMPSYHPDGISLVDGYIEMVDDNDPLAGVKGENVGKIKLLAWRGHEYIEDTTDVAGVGWILAENWWPYQRPNFVTPPFAGYISGHSTFSRAAAKVLTLLTGDEYFPGGMGVFVARKNEFLVFEEGPSVDVELQWARYSDASDQCSLSRIWGGIHPPVDDIPGRLIGEKVGEDAFNHASQYFGSILVGLNESAITDATVYPNPIKTGNQLHIELPVETTELTFSIRSVNGALVKNEAKEYIKNQELIFDMPLLQSGIYFLTIKSKSHNSSRMLVVE